MILQPYVFEVALRLEGSVDMKIEGIVIRGWCARGEARRGEVR